MPDYRTRPPIIPALVYRDSMAAFEWLQKAFGFEPAMLITDPEGKLAHSEMVFGDNGWIMVGNEWSENHKSPVNLDGKCTQSVHLEVTGIDAHCERARASGAEILMEPEDQFYGDRTYRARDLEGHIWTFGETVKEVPPEEWERETGLKTQLW